MSDDDKTMGDMRREELARLGLTNDAIRDGARFEVVQDEADPRFEWIRIRMPRVKQRGGATDVRYRGERAQWRAMHYSLASASGVVIMMMETLPLRIVEGLMLPVAVQSLNALGEFVGDRLARFDKESEDVDPKAEA